MSLNQLFSSHEIIRSPSTEIPPPWDHLFSMKIEQALTWVTDCLNLSESSRMASKLKSATDFGVVAPARRRERAHARMWTLAIMYAPTRALLFGCPTSNFLSTGLDLPLQYLQVVTKLGNMRFDQYSGVLMWPAFIEKTSADICLATSGSLSMIRPIPFFDHRSGDFDCWNDRAFATSFVFSHESGAYEKYSDAGFSGWMEKRFEENLNA
jgi:hypothetical protein